jgi:hypothetical protein
MAIMPAPELSHAREKNLLEMQPSARLVRNTDRSLGLTAAPGLIHATMMAGALSAKHKMAAIDGRMAAIDIERNPLLPFEITGILRSFPQR